MKKSLQSLNSFYSNRTKLLRQQLTEANVDGIVVSKKENIYYLTGLRQIHPTRREALLFITPSKTTLYHSPFLTPPLQTHIHTVSMSPKNSIKHLLPKIFKPKTIIAIESTNLTVSELDRFKTILPKTPLTSLPSLLEDLRTHKDESEMHLISKATDITSQSIHWAIDQLQNGLKTTEIELMHKINNHMQKLGAKNTAFPTIVAAGPHSASPHHIPTDKKISSDDVVLIDCGASYCGYGSDMTRTIKLGSADPEFNKIEQTIKKAYSDGEKVIGKANSKDPLIQIQLASPTIPTSQVDIVVRNTINNTGFGNMLHTTGHGLGLEPHEKPTIYQKSNGIFEPGMVFTIEPGIYLEGKFGYRHENTLHCAWLRKLPYS